MKHVTRAFALDFCSRGQFLLPFVISPLMLPSFWWVLFRFTELDLHSPEMSVTVGRLFSFNTFFVAVVFFSAASIPARMYFLPITTWQLVAHQVVFAGILSVLISIETSLVQNWIFQRTFPISTPALFGTVGGFAVWVVVCMTKNSSWKWVIPPAVSFGLVSWYVAQFVLVPPEQLLLPMSIVDFLILLALAAISGWIALLAVERNRCGEVMGSLPIPVRLVNGWNSVMPGERFLTSTDALFWLEWRKFGWLMPILALGVTMISVVSWSISNGDLHYLILGYARAWLAVGTASGVLVAMRTVIVITESEQRDDLKIPTFLASMPMTNRQFATALFKVIGLNGLLILGIWLTGLATVYLVAPKPELLTLEIFPEDFRWWNIPGAAFFYWLVAANFSTLLLTGNRFLIGFFSFALTLGCLVSIVILGRWVPAETRASIFQNASNILGLGCIAFTGIAFVKAYRNRLIPHLTIFACAATWLMLSVLMVLSWERSLHEKVSFLILGIGLLSLAVAPFATTPIAVCWNRSR